MIGKRFFLVTYLLLLAAALYLHLHHDLTIPTLRPLEQFPVALKGWRATGEFFLSDDVQKVLRASDYVSREYVGGNGEKVTLYVGYHSGGKESGEIHSPKHCLPGSGWYEISSFTRGLTLPQANLNLVQAVYRKGDNNELFLYWFQVRDKSIANEYALKIAEIFNSAWHRRRDASFIRISVPFEGDHRQAQAIAERFVRDFLPSIREFLPN